MTANGGTESVLITGSTRRTGGPFALELHGDHLATTA